MKKIVTLFIFISLTTLLNAQYEDPDIYLRGNDQVPQILLLGTFHFGYPGLDTHITKDENKLDILSTQRQQELTDLLTYIKLFKPTKIMIETESNTGYLMDRMRNWKAGEEKLGRRESDQIAIRLADQIGLDTIYGVDADGLAYELFQSQDSIQAEQLLGKYFAEREDNTNVFDQRYWNWYEKQDVLAYESNLLDHFKYMNDEKFIKRMHGHYILSDQHSDYNKMDGWLLLNWYSRNLRIVKNIQKIDTNPDDRILVLFGAGHIAILMQQFEASPEYELVQFKNLDKHKN